MTVAPQCSVCTADCVEPVHSKAKKNKKTEADKVVKALNARRKELEHDKRLARGDVATETI